MRNAPRSDGSAWASLLLGAPATFLTAYALVRPGAVALLSAAVSAGATAVVGWLACRLGNEAAQVPERATAAGPERFYRWCLVASACAIVAAISGLWLDLPLIAPLAAGVAYGVMTLAWGRFALAVSRAPQGGAGRASDESSAVWLSEVERIRGLTCVQMLRAQYEFAEESSPDPVDDTSPDGALQITWGDCSSTVFDVKSDWTLSVEPGPWVDPLAGADSRVFGRWSLTESEAPAPLAVAIGDVALEVSTGINEMKELVRIEIRFSRCLIRIESWAGELRCSVEA